MLRIREKNKCPITVLLMSYTLPTKWIASAPVASISRSTQLLSNAAIDQAMTTTKKSGPIFPPT